MIEFLQRQSRHLYPGYFAMVMATGALSLSLWYLDVKLPAELLLYFNIFIFVMLLVLNGLRLLFNTADFLKDLNDNGKGPGFFTLIAASGVLGSQFVVIKDMMLTGLYFWFAAFVIWFILMYTFFTLIIIKKVKPMIDESVNGGWLLVVVSTQSLAVLGTLAAHGAGSFEAVMVFISLCLYLLGCALYLNIIAFIFYRLMFLKIEALSLTPPYWISMGALAITTLAGSVLVLNGSGIAGELDVFIKGFTLFFWALGTWWIPLLITLGVWRHIVNHYPLTYTPEMWGMAFPIAMYTVGTVNLSMALDLEFLMIIPKITIFAAAIVWLMIMAGLFVHHGKRVKI